MDVSSTRQRMEEKKRHEEESRKSEQSKKTRGVVATNNEDNISEKNPIFEKKFETNAMTDEDRQLAQRT